MHKSTYQLRSTIKHGPMTLPGSVHPQCFGSEYGAEIIGKQQYDGFNVTRLCFCKLYQKNIRAIYSQRPLGKSDLRRLITRTYAASYRYIEAYITNSQGYRKYFANIRALLFPPADEWARQ